MGKQAAQGAQLIGAGALPERRAPNPDAMVPAAIALWRHRAAGAPNTPTGRERPIIRQLPRPLPCCQH